MARGEISAFHDNCGEIENFYTREEIIRCLHMTDVEKSEFSTYGMCVM